MPNNFEAVVGNPNVQKAALWVAVVVCLVLSYQYSADPQVSQLLMSLATFLSGGALLKRPGDVSQLK